MDWRRPGDKPLSEPMMVTLLTHICVTRPQWVNYMKHNKAHVPRTAFNIGVNRIMCELLNASCLLLNAADAWRDNMIDEFSQAN